MSIIFIIITISNEDDVFWLVLQDNILIVPAMSLLSVNILYMMHFHFRKHFLTTL